MGKQALAFSPIIVSSIRHKLAFSKPKASVLLFGRLFSGLYLRFILKCTSISIVGAFRILDAWRDFQAGRTRLIVAFRHPYSDEPQVFFHIINRTLIREAAREGKPLSGNPHVRFVHGYEVALWGDASIRWIMPRIGAVPIHHTKLDSGSLKAIRNIISSDEFPLAIAPEGQVSYRSETVPRLEQGTLQMGFWGVQDLENAGRKEKVVILPLSIHYKYDPRDSKKMLALLDKLELQCGIDPAASHDLPARARLTALEDRIFELAEAYYAETHGYAPPIVADPLSESGKANASRRDALMHAALRTAEESLGISAGNASSTEASAAREDFIGRVYRIRAECWDRIYPEKARTGLSSLEAALADRSAGEAWYAMRHMEFVDIAFYLDPGYLEGPDGSDPSFDRIAESANNVADLMNRLAGGTIAHRRVFMRKKIVIVPGAALDMSSRSGSYRENRKKAVETATADLKLSFENSIKEYLDENR